MERCPFCGGQLISCDCVYEKLKLKDPARYGTETAHLPPEVYRRGLNDGQAAQWDAVLRRRGLIPFIEWPNYCAMCGLLWPDLFMVPDAEWRFYIPREYQRTVICRPCYDRIKRDTEQHVAVVFPVVCAKCGRQWPEPFTVPGEEWAHYIQLAKEHETVCGRCYAFIKQVINSEKRQHARQRTAS
jgi:ferredoxin